MELEMVSLPLPPQLYQQVKQRAAKTNRPIEAELLAVVEHALVEDDNWAGIPLDIAAEVQQLACLANEDLWQAAQQIAPQEKMERMQTLVLKQQAEGLTVNEQQEAEQLQHYAQLIMLVRAEAAFLLRKRGYELSTLRQPLPKLV